jgi:hypothetical protein
MPTPSIYHAADRRRPLISAMRIGGAVVRSFLSAKEMRDGEKDAHAQAAPLDKSLSK